VAAVTVHVVDLNIVAAGDSHTVILVDDYAVAYLGIVGSPEIKPYEVIRISGGK
jgi:hypothetical protein